MFFIGISRSLPFFGIKIMVFVLKNIFISELDTAEAITRGL